MLAAGQACPESPTIPDENTRILRVRLLLEEVLELADASGISVYNNSEDSDPCKLQMPNLDFKGDGAPNLIEITDALADINYVSYGAAVAYGLDMGPLDQAVHDSNMTKFIDGHRDNNGKWIKGPSYTPVNLKPLIEQQYAKRQTDRDSQTHSSEVQLEFGF